MARAGSTRCAPRTVRGLALSAALFVVAAAGRGQVGVVQPDWPEMSTRTATGHFSGRLVDPAGNPLSGGKVAVLPSRDARLYTGLDVDWSMPDVLWLAWHDVADSGSFSVAHEDLVVRELGGGNDPFGADQFDPHLVASAPGRATRAIPAVAWDGGDTALGDIVLEPGVTVSGRLVDEAGQPLADELVWVDNSARSRSVPRELSWRETLDDLHGARTDASGTFRVAGLWPGALRVVRYPGTFEVLNEGWIEVEPGQLLDIGEHRIAPAPPEPRSGNPDFWSPGEPRPRGTGTIRGHARLASGEPAAGEWLAVMAPPGPDQREMPLLTVVRCDTRGAFVVRDWPAGDWHLRIQPGGLADVSLAGGETRDVDIDVLGYGLVRGKVTDHGKPAAGWSVHTGSIQGGETEPDGTYEMALVNGPGTEWICFGEMAWRTVVVSRWGEVITLDVDLGDVTVSGRVIDAKSGLPVSGALVQIERDEKRFGARTAPNGEFTIEAIPAAACMVSVEAVGYASLEQFLQLFDEGQYSHGRVVEDLVLKLTP